MREKGEPGVDHLAGIAPRSPWRNRRIRAVRLLIVFALWVSVAGAAVPTAPAHGAAKETENATGQVPESTGTEADNHPIAGLYRVLGKNKRGREYLATCEIFHDGGNKFRLSLRSGGGFIIGSGALNGNVISVDWKVNRNPRATQYEIRQNGILVGQSHWGHEVLTLAY